MACGAGHDAAVFSGNGVPTLMLFVRNQNRQPQSGRGDGDG
jgi:N-carbamoyl-L-amino-acid hydrolase